LDASPPPTAPLFIAVPPTGSQLLCGKQRRERATRKISGKEAAGTTGVTGKRALDIGLALLQGAGAPNRFLPRGGPAREHPLIYWTRTRAGWFLGPFV
jgi:hypothetical protein